MNEPAVPRQTMFWTPSGHPGSKRGVQHKATGRGNAARAVTRHSRGVRSGGEIPNAYEYKKPVYKKDIRRIREEAEQKALLRQESEVT